MEIENFYLDTNGYYRHKQTKKYLHRLLLGAKPGEIVDHINHNRLDNRLENLRITDRSGNAINQVRPGHKVGVSKRKGRRTWRARICVAGQEYFLGEFDSESGATIAREEAEAAYWGVNSNE